MIVVRIRPLGFDVDGNRIDGDPDRLTIDGFRFAPTDTETLLARAHERVNTQARILGPYDADIAGSDYLEIDNEGAVTLWDVDGEPERWRSSAFTGCTVNLIRRVGATPFEGVVGGEEVANRWVRTSEKGEPGGVATLGVDGLVPEAQLPAGVGGGADGASAYEVAVDNGFVGTEGDWLASLVGPEGPEGPEGPVGPLTGGAGGVLSGTYPNPGFAVNMAEQSEVDTALASKADLVGGLVPTSQLPSLAITDTFVVADQTAMLALTAERGDVAVRTDTGHRHILAADAPATLGNWVDLGAPTDAVTSVNGQVGVIVLGASDVGLSAVTNHAQLKATDLDTDGALTANSASKIPAQSAVKTYADTKVAKSSYDAGTLLYATADDTPAPKTLAEFRDLLDADDKTPKSYPFASRQAEGGTFTPSGSVLYNLLALSSYAEWTVMTFCKGTWRFSINLVTTNAAGLSTIQLSVGGVDLGSAVSTYSASATPLTPTVNADKVFTTRTQAAIRWTTNNQGAARVLSWTAWRVD